MVGVIGLVVVLQELLDTGGRDQGWERHITAKEFWAGGVCYGFGYLNS